MSLTITGLLVVILSQILPVEEVETVIGAVGILIAWYGRWRKGDLQLWGTRK